MRELPERIGHYSIESCLGSGGMGVVYKAFDTRANRYVALKVMSADALTAPGMHARFLREARLLSRVSHPHVVRVHEFDEVDGLHYLAMELIPGRNLAELLAVTGALPPARAVGLTCQIAEALHAMHTLELVHRDVKPANIAVTAAADGSDHALLLDFGIARSTGPATRMTAVNMVIGTPTYLAPEVLLGGDESPRSDVYSLGCVLFECLTGRPLFQGHETLLERVHLAGAPPRPSAFVGGLPPALDDVVLRALAKEVESRPSDAVVFAAAAEAALRPRRFDRASVTERTPGTLPVPVPVAVQVPADLDVPSGLDLDPAAAGPAAAQASTEPTTRPRVDPPRARPDDGPGWSEATRPVDPGARRTPLMPPPSDDDFPPVPPPRPHNKPRTRLGMPSEEAAHVEAPVRPVNPNRRAAPVRTARERERTFRTRLATLAALAAAAVVAAVLLVPSHEPSAQGGVSAPTPGPETELPVGPDGLRVSGTVDFTPCTAQPAPSTDQGPAATITITNDRQDGLSLLVHWIDAEGRPRFADQVAPRTSFTTATTATHRWMLSYRDCATLFTGPGTVRVG